MLSNLVLDSVQIFQGISNFRLRHPFPLKVCLKVVCENEQHLVHLQSLFVAFVHPFSKRVTNLHYNFLWLQKRSTRMVVWGCWCQAWLPVHMTLLSEMWCKTSNFTYIYRVLYRTHPQTFNFN